MWATPKTHSIETNFEKPHNRLRSLMVMVMNRPVELAGCQINTNLRKCLSFTRFFYHTIHKIKTFSSDSGNYYCIYFGKCSHIPLFNKFWYLYKNFERENILGFWRRQLQWINIESNIWTLEFRAQTWKFKKFNWFFGEKKLHEICLKSANSFLFSQLVRTMRQMSIKHLQ